MKNYVKPVIVANNEIAESVYMASGDGSWSSDCWTIEAHCCQDWNGSAKVYEAKATHSTDYVHISGCTVVTATCSATLDASKSYAEFPSTVSGNTITITRELLADSYHSGDNYTFKIWASTGVEGTTKALSMDSITISCRHDTNVQGGID